MPWSPSIGMGITEPPHSTENPAQNAIRGSEELTGKTLDFIDGKVEGFGQLEGLPDTKADGPLLQPESKKETARWGGFLFGGR